MVELPGAASGVFVNLSSLLRSSSTKERGDQEQDQGDRKDGEGLLSAQVIKAHSKFRLSSKRCFGLEKKIMAQQHTIHPPPVCCIYKPYPEVQSELECIFHFRQFLGRSPSKYYN